jgi:hypothetical protein
MMTDITNVLSFNRTAPRPLVRNGHPYSDFGVPHDAPGEGMPWNEMVRCSVDEVISPPATLSLVQLAAWNPVWFSSMPPATCVMSP